MKKNLFANVLMLLLAITLGVSCSEEDFSSYPPEFEDVIFESIDGSDNLTAGTPIKAVVVQSKKGRLLNKATYKWECEDASFEKQSVEVVYDKQNENPNMILEVPYPGSYKLKFTARYNISGQSEYVSYTKPISSGKITYTSSALYYDVVIEKNFRVK